MGLLVEWQRQVLMDEANKAGVDVFSFESWKGLVVEALAIWALKVAEFHNGDWRTGFA